MNGSDEQALTAVIQDLEDQLAAFTQDWDVHSLQKSYIGVMVCSALIACYDSLRFGPD